MQNYKGALTTIITGDWGLGSFVIEAIFNVRERQLARREAAWVPCL
jgi:hypothetical protein